MRFNTPLRYPGGKGKLTDYICRVFDENHLADGHYVEPYAGGAGIAISLLVREYASHIHLNDINKSVHAFWYSVLKKNDALCSMIENCNVTMDEWYRQKDIQTSTSRKSRLELGFSTFFLNRTNRSGIIKGGVIGGKNQDGNWKLDARFNKKDLIGRIQTISNYADRISLYNLDAAELIRDVIPNLPDKTLVYLDPPYYVKGQGLYENHYAHQDHAVVAELVTKKIKRKKWLVSYDNVPEIQALYKNYSQLVYGLNYSAQDRYKGSEIIVFGPNLTIPNILDPSNIKIAA